MRRAKETVTVTINGRLVDLPKTTIDRILKAIDGELIAALAVVAKATGKSAEDIAQALGISMIREFTIRL